jgi:hypothetical protein
MTARRSSSPAGRPSMRRLVVAFALCVVACTSPSAPCETEVRYSAHVDPWSVVCGPLSAQGVQLCAVWPTVPWPPAWLGEPEAMALHGTPLTPQRVCTTMRWTDTPGH